MNSFEIKGKDCFLPKEVTNFLSKDRIVKWFRERNMMEGATTVGQNIQGSIGGKLKGLHSNSFSITFIDFMSFYKENDLPHSKLYILDLIYMESNPSNVEYSRITS